MRLVRGVLAAVAGRGERRLPAWSVALASLLILTVAIVGVDLIYREADKYHQAALVLARLETLSLRLKLLHEGAHSGHGAHPRQTEEADAIFAATNAALDGLARPMGDAPPLGELRGAARRYESDSRQLFALLADGRAADARQWDEARVDPGHDALLAALRTTVEEADRRAERATLFANIASYVIGVIALLLIILLYRRMARTRQAAELLAAEQGALRRSEERFRALVQHSSDVVTLLDRAGAIIYQSPSVARVRGRAPELARGRDGFASVHPEDAARVRDLFAACLAEPGGTRATAFRLLHADGTWRQLDAVGTNLLHDRAVGGIVVNLRDITAHVRAEGALRRQSERLLALHEASLALAAQADPEAVLRGTLRRAVALLGAGSGSLYRWDEGAGLLRCIQNWQVPAHDTTPDQPPGVGLAGHVFARRAPLIVNDYLAWAGAMGSGVRAGLRAAVAAPLIRGGQPLGVLVVRSYDATDCFAADDARLLGLFADQAATAIENAEHLAAARRELAERERAEAALRRSEANLAAAQQIAHLGSWERDFATGEVRYSDESYRILGHEPQSFAPTFEGFIAAIHPDDRPQMVGAMGRPTPAGGLDRVEYRIVRPDGDTRVVQVQGVLQHDAAGQPGRLIGTVLDITERKALEGRLAHQAFHDPLTDLPNRALFLDRLAQALARGGRDGGGVAVLFLDLDGFKVVNDSLGHQCGDALLVEVAARFREATRPGDTVARFGGDEFAILLAEARDEADAAHVAARLLRLLDLPFAIGGQELFVGASVGIALDATGTEGPDELLRHADIALYRAKASGKGRYELFDPRMSAEARERLALEGDLRRAIERGEFVLHYQPLVALATGRVVGLEALVRWAHPERGAVPPAAFIPLAEETGLIGPLGRWILEESCRQARAWGALAPPGTAPIVSVNLSARQFQGADLVADVARVLRQAGLPADRLQLEITESVIMGDASATIATLRGLKGLGVRLAIDDFGTGYSSLAYLKRFPVDVLKIDKAFVDGLGHEPEDEAIVGAVIGLGRSLGLAVMAEGIETVAALQHLRALGCEIGQGYYFARPLSRDDAAAIVRQGRAIVEVPPLPLGHRPPLAGVRRVGVGD